MSCLDPKSTGYALIIAALITITITSPAYAQANVENMADSIQSLLTGKLARTCAGIALAVTGYQWWQGKASQQQIYSVIIGCFLVFSGPWIVSKITGA